MLWVTRRRPSDVVKWQATLVFLVIGLTLLEGYIQFNQKIGYMPMARYFFIMLLPGALLLIGGLYILAARRVLRVAAVSLPFLGLGALNTSALITVKRLVLRLAACGNMLSLIANRQNVAATSLRTYNQRVQRVCGRRREC
jgi:hypothetical protein